MPSKAIELYRQRRSAWLTENGPCLRCGSWEELEVDHIDRASKITSRIFLLGSERRLKELMKCQVLCHTCHWDKTRAEMYPPLEHGTSRFYNRGCRCDECKAQHKERMAKYVQRKKDERVLFCG